MKSFKHHLYMALWNLYNKKYPVPHPSEYADKRIKIMVFNHFDCTLPSCFNDRSIYIPLRCGNALNPTHDKTFLGDDTGDNISSFNPLVNEMTGIYWTAKNYDKIGDPDFIGFNHYRRYLQWHPSVLRDNVLISTSHLLRRPLRNDYLFVNDEITELLISRFKKDFPEYSTFDAYWKSHTAYYSNLFISDRKTFFRYAGFIERMIRWTFVLNAANTIDLTKLSPYHKRVYGFMLEHLTSFWIFNERHSGRIRHITTRADEFNIPNLINGAR